MSLRFNYISRKEGRRLLHRQARKYLGMSGEEFLRAYDAREFTDPCDSNYIRVSMLVPFAREERPDARRDVSRL